MIDPQVELHPEGGNNTQKNFTGTLLATAIAAVLCSGLTACGSADLPQVFSPRSNYEQYLGNLDSAGLQDSALGRAWRHAGQIAVTASPQVELPLAEVIYFDPARPSAVGYRMELEAGQKLVAQFTQQTSAAETVTAGSPALFVDLFRMPTEAGVEPKHLAEANDEGVIDWKIDRSGAYVIRLQTELLGGGSIRVELMTESLLSFPVEGGRNRDIGSRFGDPRDGGRRSHEGVDIFAPRGTPALAAAAGRVHRAGTNRLGGNTVWLRTDSGLSLYYAHLDEHKVRSGQRVDEGQTIGLVGNTGNARTTPPHLHFGVFSGGAKDPFPFIELRSAEIPTISVDLETIGQWRRTRGSRVNFRAGPSTRSTILDSLTSSTAAYALGARDSWYRVRLADGREGYLASSVTETTDNSLRRLTLGADLELLLAPDSGVATALIPEGEEILELARSGDHSLVRGPGGVLGWTRLS